MDKTHHHGEDAGKLRRAEVDPLSCSKQSLLGIPAQPGLSLHLSQIWRATPTETGVRGHTGEQILNFHPLRQQELMRLLQGKSGGDLEGNDCGWSCMCVHVSM